VPFSVAVLYLLQSQLPEANLDLLKKKLSPQSFPINFYQFIKALLVVVGFEIEKQYTNICN